MACLAENHNTASRPAILDVEILRSFIGDVATGSLSNTLAAAQLLRINGATPELLLAAAVAALREQASRHRDIVEALEFDHDIAEADLEDEVEKLRALLAKGATP
jgi:hypothetical protein